jgi:hypothetical protein
MAILSLFPWVFLFVYRNAFCGFGGCFLGGFSGAFGLVFGVIEGKEKSAFEDTSTVSRVAFLVAFVAVCFV